MIHSVPCREVILVRPDLKDLVGDLERFPFASLSKLRLIMDPERFTEKFCRIAVEALKDSLDLESPQWQDVIAAMAGAEQREGVKDFLTGLLKQEVKKTAEPNIALELGKLVASTSQPEQKIPFRDFVEMPICRLVWEG